ncbi:MAG: carbamate kinase [Kiritimatiellae bacterium]|nr:carbamate kinase [Kiritimatiellia bacterium]
MNSKLVVIAISGNSLISNPAQMSVLDQYRAAGETSCHIATLVKAGYRVVITHGNGPQVGFILLRSELAKDTLHQVPLESCVADTQGAIGYQIQQTLSNELRRQDIWKQVATLITQVVVDKKNPAFQNPSKPIGPFLSEEDALYQQEKEGWSLIEDAGRGWRRVVPSPKPLEIIELSSIQSLLDQDIIVVAGGGGGIPVIRTEDGSLKGCPAVIEKIRDLLYSPKEINAKTFIISTTVDQVALHFGKPNQTFIDRMSLAEARKYMEEGYFAAGSMKPKIEACIDFLENGGEEVIITQAHLLGKAIQGETGTHIKD